MSPWSLEVFALLEGMGPELIKSEGGRVLAFSVEPSRGVEVYLEVGSPC